MKKNEILVYRLADVGSESLIITVHLHQTPSGYWSFKFSYNSAIDLADRLIESLADDAGLDNLATVFLNQPPRKGLFRPTLSVSALFANGKYFPSRESIEMLIRGAFWPCWQYAVKRIMENYTPDGSWYQSVRQTEMQYLGN